MEENSLPKLRHAGFEDAWQKSLLIEQVEIRRGLTYKPSDVRNNGVRVLRSSNIAEDTFVISDDDVFVDKGAVNIPRMSNGDILVTAANGSTKLVGKHAIVKNLADDELAVHGGFMLAIKAEQNDFVNAWMSSKEYKRVLQFVQGGNGAIGNLSTSVLKSMKMTIPASKEEQSAIGSLFRTLDDLLAAYKEKLTKYQTFKSSMLSKMFPKSGQNVPEIRLAEFEGVWKSESLDDASDKIDYGMNVPSKEFDGKNKYLRITDIDDVSRKFITENLTSPSGDLADCENYLLSDSDVLFARTGASVGKTYHYCREDGRVYFAGFLIRARIKREYDANFVFQNTLTKRYKQFISVTSQRSGQPGVNSKEYGQFTINFPVISEQREVSSFFSILDTLINSCQEKISQLETLKKKLLQDMFI